MIQKKILIISPNFYPMQEGLGGYTTCFSRVLSKSCSVDVLTSVFEHKETYNLTDSCRVHHFMDGWKFPKLFRALKYIKEIAPEVILFQYLPFLYSRKGGINFSIVLLMFLLRIKGYQVQLMCHELYFPLQPNLKAIIMNLSHRLMLSIAVRSSKFVFTATERFKNELEGFFPNRKGSIFHLPVGANLEDIAITNDKIEEYRDSLGLDSDELVIASFGFPHPTKNYPLIIESISELIQETNISIKMLFIGQTYDEVKELAPPNVKDKIDSFVIALGQLDDYRVTKSFMLSDLMVAYFLDGLSTRRGSVMAALKFGLPIISTQTEYTEDVFKNRSFIKLYDPDPKVFKDELKKVVLAFNSADKDEVLSFFNSNFTWDRITQKYLSAIEN